MDLDLNLRHLISVRKTDNKIGHVDILSYKALGSTLTGYKQQN